MTTNDRRYSVTSPTADSGRPGGAAGSARTSERRVVAALFGIFAAVAAVATAILTLNPSYSEQPVTAQGGGRFPAGTLGDGRGASGVSCPGGEVSQYAGYASSSGAGYDSPRDAVRAVSGSKLRIENRAGEIVSITALRADGSVHSTYEVSRIRGKWRITGGEFCLS